MNFNELDNSAADSESDRSVGQEPQHYRQQHSSQEALSLPSAPLDPEWVSPFTLPPLPALRKNRAQSRLNRSPEERLHQRSSSSAYYAAAWGSPYATPSPSRSPYPQHIRRRSQEPDITSPLSSRSREFAPESEYRGIIALPQQSGPSRSSIKRRANSWDKSTSLSERFNWLSESDLSGGEGDSTGKTPTRETYLKGLKASVRKTEAPRARSHQVQDSVATVTPETFNANGVEHTYQHDSMATSSATMGQPVSARLEPHQPGNTFEKPLPNIPPSSAVENKPDQSAMTTNQNSPSRPRIASLQSYQRPKKKVQWKGKTCIIALPLTDRESEGLPPLLSSEDIRARIQKWVAEGYDTDMLSSDGPQDISSAFGQSRALFPDPQDMYAERKSGQLHVHIPDQAEWDAWVDYLKEEKLRALGVTPSSSEPPMSVQSPFSSTLSRVSSTYPSLVASPPLSTTSANGNPIRIAGNTFSPPLGHQRTMSSHPGSHVASPSISGYFGPMHGHKQSMAYPRLTSPYEYPVTHPGSFNVGMRSNSAAYGPRHFSPPTTLNLQSLGQVLTPMVPVVPSNDNGRGMAQHSTMEQIRQQQQRQQQLHQHIMQHQRQMSLVPPPQSRSADQLPRTPILESPNRKTPEIMHPTPRSHRHNLSAALQKGVDDAEALRSDRPSIALETKTDQLHTKPQVEEERVEENGKAETPQDQDQETELPVLKRPETLQDADDKSEIETNPSIAASPMLMNGENPFATPSDKLQQVKNLLQSQSQHKPMSSISKLNVEAPEFNPQGRFSNIDFSFGGQTFQPNMDLSNKPLAAGARPTFTPKKSISGFNVEAPAFTPSFMAHSTPGTGSVLSMDTPDKQSIATPSKSSFTFSSPAFNVEAPEFKPGQSFSFTASTQSPPTNSQSLLTSAGNIFGNVTVGANSKVNRRGTKIMPITRPKSAEDTDEEQNENIDDEGRIGAPSDRQKRARRIGGDEDEELMFAVSAPFSHRDGLTSQKDDSVVIDQGETTVHPETQESELAEYADTKTPAPAETMSDATIESSTEQRARSLTEAAHDPETLPQRTDARVALTETEPALSEDFNSGTQDSNVTADNVSAKIQDENLSAESSKDGNVESEVQPAQSVVVERLTELPQVEDQATSEEPIQSKSNASISKHNARSSLSALAKPFEFRSSAVPSVASRPKSPVQTASESKKSQGLMASRFATVSPPLEKMSGVDSAESPPPELYEYVRPEDVGPAISELSHSRRGRATPRHELPDKYLEATPDLVKSIEASMRSESAVRVINRSPSQSSRVDESMPSYEEIDAVMKQFEDNPELGVERDDTPVKPTPTVDMRVGPMFHDDAFSPSPKRTSRSPQRRPDWGLGIHRLNEGNGEISDWNNEFSPRQVDKLQSQARHFDSRLTSLVDGMLEHKLVPFEQTLHAIQQSLMNLVDKGSKSSGNRDPMNGRKDDSDADDEDESDTIDRLSSYRSRSPSRSQRKTEKIRAAVIDALASHNAQASERSVPDMSEIHATLNDIKKLSQQRQQPSIQEQPDLRALMEDVISNHAHFKSMKNQDDYEAIQVTNKLKVDVLESSLKEAEERVKVEIALRQQADVDVKQLYQKLIEAQEQADKHREASEAAQSKIATLKKEQEAHEELRLQHSDVLEKNRAVEDLLKEYRVSSDQFRDDIKLERARNEDLIRRLRNLREDFNEKLESRQALRDQLERLQDRMGQVMDDVHAEEAEWRSKEQELVLQNKTLQAALDHEIRHRQRLETENGDLLAERKESIRMQALHENVQQEVTGLREQITVLNEERKSLSEKSFKLERELSHSRESASGDLTQATVRLQSELEAARATIESLKTDYDAQISRLEKRLDHAELDLEDQKAKHDEIMSEATESHTKSLHEANEKREVALEEMHSSHERKLNDLRERHTRALHNSSDDRHRLEYHLNEKLAISEERTKHMEGQIKDLEERLEITKSAARAAVEAATAKTTNIPTPAPSVMASPPQRASSASVPITKGTGLPEKISPQAMRESILVLQEQLQNREHMIEQLEAELGAVDKDAPLKLKERDNEIALLRELLSVRVDDLNEIIATLSQSSFDQEAAKHAAIRLKANIQMEQQLKERAASIGGFASALPSLSTISSYAPSPRDLPMAAAAAWGNWRKARDFSLNAVSDIAANIGQTPSKSTTGSPSRLLAGIMTPPSTSQRTPPVSEDNASPPSTMRPLAAAAAASRKNSGNTSEARPLRPFSIQARTLSSRQAEKRRSSTESTSPSTDSSKQQPKPWPETPTTSRNFKGLDLGDDVDEDASPINTNEHEHTGAESVAEDVVST